MSTSKCVRFKFSLYVFLGLLLVCSNNSLAEEVKGAPEFQSVLQEAKSGNAKMQYLAGKMYLEGRYVNQDDKQAVRWFEKAAKKGFPLAQYRLGWMYRNELGDQPAGTQQTMAFNWLEIAAKNGVAKAQYQLGVMYANGISVQVNNIQAVKWLELAAQSDAEAQDRLGQMYSQGLGVDQNFVKAKELFLKSCDGGFKYGCINYKSLNEKVN